MSFSHIWSSCGADPFAASQSFSVAKTYEYSPLIIEASILSSEENILSSTNQIRKILKIRQLRTPNLGKELEQFLQTRVELLKGIRLVPQVGSFVRFTLEKAEEVKNSQEEIMDYLAGIEATEDSEQELSRLSRPKFGRRVFLVDAIRTGVLNGNQKLEESILAYIKCFDNLLNWLIDQRAGLQSIYTVLSTDVQFIAAENSLLRTGQSIAIPLDLSPLRLSLAMLRKKDVFDQSRKYYPPMFLLFNPDARAFNLARPYRTIDGHPALIRAAKFEPDRTTAQRETSDARKNFENNVGPLLHAVKGLAGTGETAPSLITKPLVQVVLSYLTYNPLSREMLRIMDLGCGTGSLMRKIFVRVFDEDEEEGVSVYALLNDDSQEDPGKRFRNLMHEEEYARRCVSRTWKGDLRGLITELSSLEQFDITFLNRVLDMYGGYGVFEFKLSSQRVYGACSSITKGMPAIDPNVGNILAFAESTCHEGAWRAIKYIFEGQAYKRKIDLHFLPAIDMKMKKNFFDFNESDVLKLLLEISKLLVISVFPGNFRVLFPESDDIFSCEKCSPISYSIICISKDKKLIEHIKKRQPDFVANNA